MASTAANPKMMVLCNQTAQSSAHHVCAEDGYFKHPHMPIIDGDKGVDSGYFLLGIGIGGRLTRNSFGGSCVCVCNHPLLQLSLIGW
jgi:hypothetical protein